MKKILALLLLVCIIFTGCGNVVPDKNTSSNIDTYEWQDYYIETEYGKFNSPASENHLEYTLIQINGIVTNKTDDIIFIESDDNNKWIFSFSTANIGDEGVFYGLYLGTSQKYDDTPCALSTRTIINGELTNTIQQGQEIFRAYEGYSLEELQSRDKGTSSNKISNGSFEITTEEIQKQISTDEVQYELRGTYNYDNCVVDKLIAQISGTKIQIYKSLQNNKPFAISAYDVNARSSTRKDIIKVFDGIMNILGVDLEITADFKKMDEGYSFDASSDGLNVNLSYDKNFGVTFFVSIEENNTDINELPLHVRNENDFFADEGRMNSYNEYRENYDIENINIMVSEYIDSNMPTENDSCYKIQRVINDCKEIDNFKNIVIEHDDVENDTKVFYSGLDSISRNNNFVTYIEEKSVFTKVGFIADDWIFFDEIIISNGTDKFEHSYKSYDITTDVLDDGSITEWNRIIVSDKEEDIILSENSNVTIRFKNDEDDKYLDHQLTETEIQAFSVIRELHDVYKSLEYAENNWLKP